MSYGLLQQGNTTKQQAMGGIRQAAQLEQNRNQANDNIDRQEKSAKTSNVATGATMGWMAGAQAGSVTGPWGAVAGAAAGFLLSELI